MPLNVLAVAYNFEQAGVEGPQQECHLKRHRSQKALMCHKMNCIWMCDPYASILTGSEGSL